ncbi:uncharacterized protein LOC128552025 [Mercenaria mercenaria]|uniref:uncharacterized protein LOC128552025 n=1 Tax=Mercenaria mercenaria TaxID=6596 RepID=UPI00234E853B|nr:uncharacterized protein LOC128552025 [Mercenaria mercenaria]
MGISVNKICVGINTLLLVYGCSADGADDLICTGTTFYRIKENGQAGCKECRPCVGGGIGWNTTVKRREDEHGFRSCYQCTKCPSGTYRDLESTDSRCKPCTLDCLRLHRYGSVRCGGANPGHCGECRTGYVAHSKESNSMCTIRTTQVTDKPSTNHTETILETRSSVSGENSDYPIANLLVWILGGTVFLLLTFVIILCVVGRNKSHNRNKKKSATASAKDGNSTRALIGSGSTLGEDSLEVDYVAVRAERPECLTIEELEALRTGQEIEICDRVLDKDDETITIVSKKVSGESRHELFQTYLKIEKSKTDPEEEKWEKHIISFSAYILEVLKIWLQQAGKEATLKALCNALKMASFDKIVDEILDLPENQTPPTNAEIKETIEINIADV